MSPAYTFLLPETSLNHELCGSEDASEDASQSSPPLSTSSSSSHIGPDTHANSSINSGCSSPAFSLSATSADSTDESALALNHCIRGMNPHPIVMVKGQGSYLWDDQGRRYLDFLSAFCAASQGHCHPQIVAAMIEQCQKLMLPSRAVHNEWYPKLCQRVCELLGYDQAAMTNSGSEAVDFAIKAARKWGYQVKKIPPGEAIIVTMTASFHGRTIGPISASNRKLLREDVAPLIPNIITTLEYGSIPALKALMSSPNASNIAAIMLEPIQGHAGCLTPPAGYLRAVKELCSRHNILFIADEVQCGLGRTGELIACQMDGQDVKPDVLILGKAVSGGAYAVGMVLASRQVMGLFKEGQHGSTFAGNPLVSAVSLAAIKVIVGENLPERARNLHNVLQARCRRITSAYYGGIIGRGLLCSIIINETHPGGRVTADRLTNLLLSRGVLTYTYGNMIRVAPPLVIREEELVWGLDRVEEALLDLEHMTEEMT